MNINYKLLLLSIFIPTISFAQLSDKTILDPTNSAEGIPLPVDHYDDSVIFIQDLNQIRARSSQGKQALTITIVNFDNRFKLLPAYRIGDVEYCDNGQYNDVVAGDGIFTSVKKFNVNLGKSTNGIEVSKGTEFKYEKEMQALLNTKFNDQRSSGIKFSCKVRTITCPETNWWNSCWPLSSPCTCLDFYDCELELEIDF
ncbi:MAG: hypothetical protein HKO94_06375 [Flavobacteriaceae bacterium]|nr:hypothetical protein [Flavobacteriaceae bacterium]